MGHGRASRVLVIAPTAAKRTRLEALATMGSARVVVSAGLSRGWRRQLFDTQPDLLLVEADTVELESVLRALARGRHPPATVVLTDDSRRAWNARRNAGVRAVLPRTATAAEITAALDSVAAGLLVIHPGALDRPRSDPEPMTPALRGDGASTLTSREVEILGMMAEGLGNKIIAGRLGISTHTVKFHIAAIFMKLKAGSRTEAVILGIRNGLILV